MWIGGEEGAGYSYEIIALSDGYLVQMRDLDNGQLEIKDCRLFHTVSVAFAHARAMAAIDRFAAKILMKQDASEEKDELIKSRQELVLLREQFTDEGCFYDVMVAQEPLELEEALEQEIENNKSSQIILYH